MMNLKWGRTGGGRRRSFFFSHLFKQDDTFRQVE
jgi:hypothetical protein